MSVPTIITSDSMLPDVSRHFRVLAGPGAGKTHWLAQHIRNVVSTSKTLGPTQRIGCISYTNVAAVEIIERLGQLAWQVDASTIHSFLYRNVVRPYVWLLRDDKGAPVVDFRAVDGHQEHQPIRKFVEAWLNSVSTKGAYLVNELLNKNWSATYAYLRRVRWQFDPAVGDWKPLLPKMAPPSKMPVTRLAGYKSHYWAVGIIDHDDVLFFAHQLLNKSPDLRRFVAARFPYLFIDEFQDTNPVQLKLTEWLAEAGSVVGVVGDPEQAIFGFQGATRAAFDGFSLPGHDEYRIEDNRRSSKQIVALLNHVRRDGLKQQAVRGNDGPEALLLVGPAKDAVAKVEQIAGQDLVVLARSNESVAALRGGGGTNAMGVWETFRNVDSTSGRPRFWDRMLTALELARAKHFGEAVDVLARAICRRNGTAREPFKFDHSITHAQRDGLSVALLECVLQKYNAFADELLTKLYGLVAETAEKVLPGLKMKSYSKGAPKDFAERTTVRALAAAVILEDETRRFRTIHKSKSAEFESVLVCLADEECLKHMTGSCAGQEEEQRITYVALSRARDRLAISVPSLSSEREAAMGSLGIKIIRLPERERDD